MLLPYQWAKHVATIKPSHDSCLTPWWALRGLRMEGGCSPSSPQPLGPTTPPHPTPQRHTPRRLKMVKHKLLPHLDSLLLFLSFSFYFHILLICFSVSLSVLSDSLRPRGLQPTRFLCWRNSPDKNIGMGSHSLLQGIFPTQLSNPGLLHCRQIPSLSEPFTLKFVEGQ